MKAWLKENLGLFITLVITTFYLIGIICITDLSEYKTLDLNEKGDFLAGVFSPLAFLWLVFGYFQQGNAIKLSNQNILEQLKLQKDERLEREHAVQPIFNFEAEISNYEIDNDKLKIDLKIRNKGEKITAVQLMLGEPLTQFLSFRSYLENDEVYLRTILISKSWVSAYNDTGYAPLPIEIYYRTSIGLHYKTVFVLNISTVEVGMYYENYADYIKVD